MKGSIWYVGAGPGDPELISVRGKQLLEKADLVVHDNWVASELLEQCTEKATRVNTQISGTATDLQIHEIAGRIVTAASNGKNVVRLKVGDPLFFSRALDEIRIIRAANLKVEVVPGIASPLVTSFAGVPLSNRSGSPCVVFTSANDLQGHPTAAETLAKRAESADTFCVLCLGTALPTIVTALSPLRQFASHSCLLVSRASTPEQRVLEATLDQITSRWTAEDYPEPCLLIAGEVTEWRRHLSWFEERPLFGKRLLLCRPRHQALDSAQLMRERGARPILLPLIEIRPPNDATALNQCVRELGVYDWIILTSANGAERLVQAIATNGRDARAFGTSKIAVIGPGTARPLATLGIVPDLVADEHVAEGLARQLLAHGPIHSALLVRAEEARDTLPTMLRKAGATVDVVTAYVTRKLGAEQRDTLIQLFESKSVDAVLLTSSSMADALADSLGPQAATLLSHTCVASIGPVTSATLKKRGIHATLTAHDFTIEGLLDAIEAQFSNGAALAGGASDNAI